jgi:hypothetical protein
LAKKSGLGLSTVVDFERERRVVSPDAIGAMRHALEKAGVEFTNGKRPGVRLKSKFLTGPTGGKSKNP